MTCERDDELAAWSRSHGGYDPATSRAVRTWLRLVAAAARPAARRGLPADVVTAAGVLAAAAAVAAPPLPAAGLVLATAVCDGVDGAVARATGRSGPRGTRVDHAADRVTDVLFAFALLGRSRAAGAAAATLGFEAGRARLRRRGVDDVVVVTVGERPMRVATVALGLLACAVTPRARRPRVAGAAGRLLTAQAIAGAAQLAVAVRRDRPSRRRARQT